MNKEEIIDNVREIIISEGDYREDEGRETFLYKSDEIEEVVRKIAEYVIEINQKTK